MLISCLGGIAEADRTLAPQVDRQLLSEVLDEVPDEWLEPDGPSAAEVRARYLDYLLARLASDRSWLPRTAAA